MDKKYSKDQIYDFLYNTLNEDFEIDKSSIKENSNLFEDLDLDSIDAVDLAVRLQEWTNKRISPDEFNQIRTVEDVVEVIYSLL
jgi:acyl carrier protein